MKKEVKALARKTKAEIALDLRDQYRQKKKTSRRLIQIILMVKVILDMMELKVICISVFKYIKPSTNNKKLQNQNLKAC